MINGKTTLLRGFARLSSWFICIVNISHKDGLSLEINTSKKYGKFAVQNLLLILSALSDGLKNDIRKA